MDWSIVLSHVTLPDLIGHVTYVTMLIGTYLLTKKKKFGWILRGVGNLGWIMIGYMLGFTSMMMWSSVLWLNDLRGFLIWREHENSQLQIKGTRVTKTCSQKDNRSVRTPRRGRSKSPYGKSRGGYNDEQFCLEIAAVVNRMQKYENVPKLRSLSSVEIQHEALADFVRRLEASEKGNGKRDYIPKPRRLPKTSKGKK